MTAPVARSIMVRGQVQGVWFRNWTVDQARGLGLTGWVRNRRDGSVEILASGDLSQIERLAALCRQGPAAAQVSDVLVTEAEEAAPAHGFERRPTA